jgi:NAD(P)H-dependent FMN reductase
MSTEPAIPTIALVVASSRPARFADQLLPWLTAQLEARGDLNLTIADIREHPLPPFDRPMSPSMGPRSYESDHERALGETFGGADGFLVLTNEYNHSFNGAFKNALDYYFAEFHRKPVAFAGYGNVGGARAIEQLRNVFSEYEAITARHALHILPPQFMGIRNEETRAETFAGMEARLDQVVTDLLWWTNALKTARDADALADALVTA